MKLRNPKEFAAAVTRIRSALGEEGCARAVGRSDSLVRKWADPDHPAIPNLDQALSLDAAYVAAGHGDAPIFELYQDQLEDRINGAGVLAGEIVPAALMVQSIVGDLSEIIRECLGQEGGALVLSHNSRISLLSLIDRLEEETDRLEDAVEATGGENLGA
tara:strand:+ start:187 stop:666 length:480 start_codon:yes stop_codon:yes gene_type:complete